jgi:hypothetical protein
MEGAVLGLPHVVTLAVSLISALADRLNLAGINVIDLQGNIGLVPHESIFGEPGDAFGLVRLVQEIAEAVEGRVFEDGGHVVRARVVVGHDGRSVQGIWWIG